MEIENHCSTETVYPRHRWFTADMWGGAQETQWVAELLNVEPVFNMLILFHSASHPESFSGRDTLIHLAHTQMQSQGFLVPTNMEVATI